MAHVASSTEIPAVQAAQPYPDLREEQSLNAAEDWETATRQTGGMDEDFDANSQILRDGGYVESTTVRSFRSTSHGYDAIREFRERAGLGRQFDHLREAPPCTPTKRTSVLAALLEAKYVADAWNVDHAELEHGTGEVTVLHRDLKFFLVICEWPNGELPGAVMRDLRRCVISRPGTFGCVFAMARVLDAMISDSQPHLETACIIFGPTDLAALFPGGSMSEMMGTKMVNARIRRAVMAAWRYMPGQATTTRRKRSGMPLVSEPVILDRTNGLIRNYCLEGVSPLFSSQSDAAGPRLSCRMR